MNTRMQISAKPMTAPHRSSEPFGILRRKCACGGSGGSSGECAECAKKKLQRRAVGSGPETAPPIVNDGLRSGRPLDARFRASLKPRFGHNFGGLRIHSADNASESVGPFHAPGYMTMARGLRPPTIGGSEPLGMFQVPVDAPDGTEDPDGEALEDGESSATYQDSDEGLQLSSDGGQPSATAGDNPFSTDSGAPLCANGGGESKCDILAGIYRITRNDNTCCTRDCTQQHEQRHVQDLGDCCKQAFEARRISANPNKVTDVYNRWVDQARPWTECNAYSNDVKCGTAMGKANDCDGKGKDSACCRSISQYVSHYGDEAKKACDAAPAKLPPCPNFALATLVGD